MSGVVETVEIDPTQSVGRLLHSEGWRVERTFPYDGGTFLYGGEVWLGGYSVPSLVKRVPQGDTVTVVVEDTTCPNCKGIGKFGGPGSYYDRPGGKPCWTCNGDGVVIEDTPTDDVTDDVRQAVQ